MLKRILCAKVMWPSYISMLWFWVIELYTGTVPVSHRYYVI